MPDQPVALKLNAVEPLADAQMRLLCLASPWNPFMIRARLGEWNDALQAFDAVVVEIESPPKLPAPEHRKTLRWGLQKRKRGLISHD
jgi:hypothetical protein